MNSRPSRHIVALVSLLVFLLTGQAAAHGYVWCLGADGHTALEYAARDNCGPASEGACRNGHAERTPGALAGDEHCGPCLDIPATFDAAPRQARPQKEYIQARIEPAAGSEVFPLPRFVPVLAAGLHLQPPPRITPTILHLRTVVLLN